MPSEPQRARTNCTWVRSPRRLPTAQTRVPTKKKTIGTIRADDDAIREKTPMPIR